MKSKIVKKSKTLNKHNNLKVGGANDILSLFYPDNPLVHGNLDDYQTKENIDFIKKQINTEIGIETSNENNFNSTVKQLFKDEKYFYDLIKKNYDAGINKNKLLVDNKNQKIVVDLHGTIQPNIFKLPNNVNVIFMSPVSYISCTRGSLINYLNKQNNLDNLDNFLKDPSCFNKNKSGIFFNQSVIYYGGQYCIDLLMGRGLPRELGLAGPEMSTGIHIYDNNSKTFIVKNEDPTKYSKIEEKAFDNLGIPKNPNLSYDKFPSNLENGIIRLPFKNESDKNSYLSNFLKHFFSNDKNQNKQFTIFFESCREMSNQSNKETLSFYEKIIKYLNFKIHYDNNKSKSKTKSNIDIDIEYKKCFSSPTIFSNNYIFKENKYMMINSINHNQTRKTKNQLIENKKKYKLKSRIKPTITNESIIEITTYNNDLVTSILFKNITPINNKIQITLNQLKINIKNKDKLDIFHLLFTLLSLIFKKDIFEYDKKWFSYKQLDFIELIKFILNEREISDTFRFIIYFGRRFELNKISYINLIKLFLDQTPEISIEDENIQSIITKSIPSITLSDIENYNDNVKTVSPHSQQSLENENENQNNLSVLSSEEQKLYKKKYAQLIGVNDKNTHLYIDGLSNLVENNSKDNPLYYTDELPNSSNSGFKARQTELNNNIVNLILQNILQYDKKRNKKHIIFLRSIDSNINDAGATIISTVLQNNNVINNINLHNNKIGNIGAISFAQFLSQTKSLRELNLSYNKIDDVGAIALANALKSNTSLHNLDLNFNEINEKGIEAFLDLLVKKDNNVLKILKLIKLENKNTIKENQMIIKITNILDNFTGKEINLTDLDKDISDFFTNFFTTALKSNTTNTTNTTNKTNTSHMRNEYIKYIYDVVKKALETNTLEFPDFYYGYIKNTDIIYYNKLLEDHQRILNKILELLKDSNIKRIDNFKNENIFIFNLFIDSLQKGYFKYLNDINLVLSEIGNNETIKIAKALKNHPNIKTLWLGQNKIGNAGIKSLIKLLINNNKITLQIDYNEPPSSESDVNENDDDDVKLEIALPTEPIDNYETNFYNLVQIINLISNIHSSDEFEQDNIAPSNYNLLGVKLYFNDYGAAILSNFLINNTLIKKISFFEETYINHIGDFGAKAIAELLKRNKTITEFNLLKNLIGDVGAIALADTLKINKTLHILNLSQNKISDEGAIALANALKSNHTLHTLDLSANQAIGNASIYAFLQLLYNKENSVLKKLSLVNFSFIDDESKKKLKLIEQILNKDSNLKINNVKKVLAAAPAPAPASASNKFVSRVEPSKALAPSAVSKPSTPSAPSAPSAPPLTPEETLARQERLKILAEKRKEAAAKAKEKNQSTKPLILSNVPPPSPSNFVSNPNVTASHSKGFNPFESGSNNLPLPPPPHPPSRPFKNPNLSAINSTKFASTAAPPELLAKTIPAPSAPSRTLTLKPTATPAPSAPLKHLRNSSPLAPPVTVPPSDPLKHSRHSSHLAPPATVSTSSSTAHPSPLPKNSPVTVPPSDPLRHLRPLAPPVTAPTSEPLRHSRPLAPPVPNNPSVNAKPPNPLDKKPNLKQNPNQNPNLKKPVLTKKLEVPPPINRGSKPTTLKNPERELYIGNFTNSPIILNKQKLSPGILARRQMFL